MKLKYVCDVCLLATTVLSRKITLDHSARTLSCLKVIRQLNQSTYMKGAIQLLNQKSIFISLIYTPLSLSIGKQVIQIVVSGKFCEFKSIKQCRSKVQNIEGAIHLIWECCSGPIYTTQVKFWDYCTSRTFNSRVQILKRQKIQAGF